jgi:hypothetical protein
MEEMIKKDIAEAEVQEKIEDIKEEKKIDFRFEIALFLILGFLLGIVIKTEASKRITIGYNDGSVVSMKQGYDFDKIEKEIAEKTEAAAEQVPQN